MFTDYFVFHNTRLEDAIMPTTTAANERLLKLPDVIGDRRRGIVGLLPMSRSKFYAGIQSGLFPAPLHIGCGSFWKLSAIMKIIEG